MKNRFTNAMQFKSFVKKRALQEHIDPRLLIQEFALDDLLERISLSNYRNNFVLKGGFLIASILGIGQRATRDLDTTALDFPLNERSVFQAFQEICLIMPENDPIELYPTRIETIRDNDEYGGYRVHFSGLIYGMIKPEIKIDISTGDKITPREIKYRHHLITENRFIIIKAYNLETILAEKLEAILSKGAGGTRPKDYYDVYALLKLEEKNINKMLLKRALVATVKHRGSSQIIVHYKSIIESILSDGDIKQWMLNMPPNFSRSTYHLPKLGNEFHKSPRFQRL